MRRGNRTYTATLCMCLLVLQALVFNHSGAAVYISADTDTHHSHHSMDFGHEIQIDDFHDDSDHVHEKTDTVYKDQPVKRSTLLYAGIPKPSEDLPVKIAYRLERPPKVINS